MTVDAALRALRRTDPDYYLLEDRRCGRGWCPATDLRLPDVWSRIGPAYGADVGAPHRVAAVVGGSCALQGYAWRVASLSIGRWAIAGAGLRLRDAELWVRLRDGRTVGLAFAGGRIEPGPTTPERIAVDLVAHLEPIVAASRAVSRLREAVAWGNVASAVASAWRRVHESAPPARRDEIAGAAMACLAAPIWSWASNPPLTWWHTSTERRSRLLYRRHTCCLMRLSPSKRECGTCSILDDDEVIRRWTESVTAPPALPKLPG